jgi:hypothetical protein
MCLKSRGSFRRRICRHRHRYRPMKYQANHLRKCRVSSQIKARLTSTRFLPTKCLRARVPGSRRFSRCRTKMRHHLTSRRADSSDLKNY